MLGFTQVATIDSAVYGCSDFTHGSAVSTVNFEQVNTGSSPTIVKTLLIHCQLIKVAKFTNLQMFSRFFVMNFHAKAFQKNYSPHRLVTQTSTTFRYFLF